MTGFGIPNGVDPRYLEAFLPTITTIVLAWLIVTGLTGWLAGRRNWDGGLWTLLGLLAGPVALLVVLLAPKRFSGTSPYSGASPM